MSKSGKAVGIAHGSGALWALIQVAAIYNEYRVMAPILYFYLSVFLLSGSCAIFLLVSNRAANFLVITWNWILLATSLLTFWLAASPDFRLPELPILVVAALICATY